MIGLHAPRKITSTQLAARLLEKGSLLFVVLLVLEELLLQLLTFGYRLGSPLLDSSHLWARASMKA